MSGEAGAVTWVLLRGLAREAGHWGDFARELQAALPGSRVLTPDLPGCGTEGSQRSATTVAGLLACVREGVGKAAPGQRLCLFGLSMGGMIALEWSRQHPEDLAGVVLVNSSAGGVSAPWRRLRPGAIWGLARAALAPDADARERRVFSFTSARPDRRAVVLPRWTELARLRPVARATAARHLLAAGRYRYRRPAEGTISPPVLVLVSERDGMVSPACSLALAGRLGAPVRRHPTAGHDLPLDDPEWVITQLADWARASRIA